MEFLASAGPVTNFLFGVTGNNLWSLIEGVQLIVYYPMLIIEAPANLGLLQAGGVRL